jgi:hypothetical protein
MSEFSENGAPLRTGRGIEEIRRKITEAFDRQRIHEVMVMPVMPAPPEGVLHGPESFHANVKELTTAAMTTVYVAESSNKGPYIVVTPTESAEELFKLALK